MASRAVMTRDPRTLADALPLWQRPADRWTGGQPDRLVARSARPPVRPPQGFVARSGRSIFPARSIG